MLGSTCNRFSPSILREKICLSLHAFWRPVWVGIWDISEPGHVIACGTCVQKVLDCTALIVHFEIWFSGQAGIGKEGINYKSLWRRVWKVRYFSSIRSVFVRFSGLAFSDPGRLCGATVSRLRGGAYLSVVMNWAVTVVAEYIVAARCAA
jgi:hypothetical protein